MERKQLRRGQHIAQYFSCLFSCQTQSNSLPSLRSEVQYLLRLFQSLQASPLNREKSATTSSADCIIFLLLVEGSLYKMRHRWDLLWISINIFVVHMGNFRQASPNIAITGCKDVIRSSAAQECPYCLAKYRISREFAKQLRKWKLSTIFFKWTRNIQWTIYKSGFKFYKYTFQYLSLRNIWIEINWMKLVNRDNEKMNNTFIYIYIDIFSKNMRWSIMK